MVPVLLCRFYKSGLRLIHKKLRAAFFEFAAIFLVELLDPPLSVCLRVLPLLSPQLTQRRLECRQVQSFLGQTQNGALRSRSAQGVVPGPVLSASPPSRGLAASAQTPESESVGGKLSGWLIAMEDVRSSGLGIAVGRGRWRGLGFPHRGGRSGPGSSSSVTLRVQFLPYLRLLLLCI